MNPADYWLLDVAVEALVPLHWLVAENLEEAFNRASHGLSTVELTRRLHCFFQDGDLFAVINNHGVRPEVVAPMPDQIQAAFARKLHLTYGLTAQGGQRWEAVSRPNWDQYISTGYGVDPYEAEIIARHSAIAEQYVRLQHYKWPFAIVANTKVRDTLVPWRATYWKTLPIGYRIRFSYLPEENLINNKPPEIEAWFREFEVWYTNPFEE